MNRPLERQNPRDYQEINGAMSGVPDIARQGYAPVHGARPLQRFLQRALETPLSRQLISGDITDHSRVTVDFKKGELVFEAKLAKEQARASRLSHSPQPASSDTG